MSKAYRIAGFVVAGCAIAVAIAIIVEVSFFDGQKRHIILGALNLIGAILVLWYIRKHDHKHVWETHLLDGSNDVSPFVDCKCGAQGVNTRYMG